MLNCPVGSKYTVPKSPHSAFTFPCSVNSFGSELVDPTIFTGLSSVLMSSSMSPLLNTDSTLPESAITDHFDSPAGILPTLVANDTIQLGHSMPLSSSLSSSESPIVANCTAAATPAFLDQHCGVVWFDFPQFPHFSVSHIQARWDGLPHLKHFGPLVSDTPVLAGGRNVAAAAAAAGAPASSVGAVAAAAVAAAAARRSLLVPPFFSFWVHSSAVLVAPTGFPLIAFSVGFMAEARVIFPRLLDANFSPSSSLNWTWNSSAI